MVTPDNLEPFMVDVKQGLQDLENHVSKIASFVIDELEMIKLQSERIVGDLFEESVEGSPLAPSVPMAAPDTGLNLHISHFYYFLPWVQGLIKHLNCNQLF